MEGTRVQILREIEAWAKDLTGPQIFWLTGMAGTGKSAIAWTVCSRVSSDPMLLLGGSFFCSRSTGLSAQRDVRCVVPTLSLLLSRQSQVFSQALAAELAVDPDILHQQVDIQVEKLLYRPLLALKNSPIPIVFVMDALDECGSQLTANGMLDDAETHRIVSDMLEALVKFSCSSVKLPVKFLVTSRPETHIRDTHVSDTAFSKVLRLHAVDKQQVTADIHLYIANRLIATPKLSTLFAKTDVQTLVQFCDGLFIVAATALEHVLGGGTDAAVPRFRSLLNAIQGRLSIGSSARLDRMYAVILEDAAKPDAIGTDNFQVLLRLLAALLVARMTLSVAALADLINEPKERLRATMSRIHAVIHVPDDDDDASLRPLHASFGEYLFGRATSNFRIAESDGHDALACGCFHLLENNLYFNISHSRSSFERNSSTKPASITLSLEYACLQWVYHVSGSLVFQSKSEAGVGSALRSWFWSWFMFDPIRSLQSRLDRKINEIFRPRLLFWLEVMSILGQVQRSIAMLIVAAATVRDPTGGLSTLTLVVCRSVSRIFIGSYMMPYHLFPHPVR